MAININQLLEYEGFVNTSDVFAVESDEEETVKCPYNQLLTIPSGFLYPNISALHIDVPVGGNRNILTTELNSLVTVSNDVVNGSVTLPDMTGLDDGYTIIIVAHTIPEDIIIKNNGGTTLITLTSSGDNAIFLNDGTSWIKLSSRIA